MIFQDTSLLLLLLLLLHGTAIVATIILLGGLRGLLRAALLRLGRLHLALQHLHLVELLRVVRRQVGARVALPAAVVQPAVALHPLLQPVDRSQGPSLVFSGVM